MAEKTKAKKEIETVKPVESSSPEADKISFSVYARMRRLDSSLHKAMMLFPPAVGKEVASLIEWDEIFKNF